MFDRDFRITGKHANYWKDLCELPGNVADRELHANFKIFKAYIDAYILCPLIGLQYGRKGTVDNSVKAEAGMLSEILGKRRNELKLVYQIIMLADEDSEPNPEKRVYRAFRLSETAEEDKLMIQENMKIFNSYFRGGLEVLHEIFVDECVDDDDYLKKIETFVRNFYEEQDGDALKAELDKILNG